MNLITDIPFLVTVDYLHLLNKPADNISAHVHDNVSTCNYNNSNYQIHSYVSFYTHVLDALNLLSVNPYIITIACAHVCLASFYRLFFSITTFFPSYISLQGVVMVTLPMTT